jgi:carboxyl-terminal processing protease
VSLRVQRGDAEEYLDFEVARDRIRTPSVETERLGDGLAWVRILQFQENTGRELRRALASLDKRKQPLRGLVLDLRSNPGGFLDEAVEVVDVFLDGGTILTTRGRNIEERVHVARAPGSRAQLPLVVLQNQGSASAAEIVSGALQDHQRAPILGTTSYGKGSVQTTYEFADGSALKLTIARLYTPNDRTIQGTGVEPDVPVEEDEAPWVDPDGVSVYVEGLDLSAMPTWVLEDSQMCAAVTTLLQGFDE